MWANPRRNTLSGMVHETDDPQQAFSVKSVLRNLRGNPPGPATDDRWGQINAFTGVVYIAVLAVARGLASASVDVLAYKPKGRKSFSVGGTIVKSQTSSNGQARDEDYVPVKFDHPLSRLFRKINAQDTLGNFLTDWVIQRKLTGTAHVWTPRMAGFDKPAEMWVLPTPFLQYLPPRPDMPNGGYNLLNMTPTGGGFMYQNGGACQLDGRQILRHQYKHPLYKWDGYSPLSGVGEQLDVLRAIDMARKSSMDNEVDPSIILALKGATQEECERVAHAMSNRHGGAENRKKVMVSASEDVSAEFPTRAAKDMDYAGGWDQMVKFGFAGLGVLPTVAGVNEAGSYAQLYAARRQFYDQTLKVEADEIGQFLTKHLAAPHYGDRFVVKLNVPPPDNEEMLDKQIDQDGRNGMITVNQGLALRGREKVADGDVPPTIYLKMLEQKVMPQPDPMGGGMGGPPMPGGAMGGGGQPPLPPSPAPVEGAAGGDESPEDSLVNAIMAQLEDDEQPVQKGWVQIQNSRTGQMRAQNQETKNIVYGENAKRALQGQQKQAAKTDPDVHNFNPANEEDGRQPTPVKESPKYDEQNHLRGDDRDWNSMSDADKDAVAKQTKYLQEPSRRKVFEENADQMIRNGSFGGLAGRSRDDKSDPNKPTGPPRFDLAKAAAYRAILREKGYDIGPLQFDGSGATYSAKIVKRADPAPAQERTKQADAENGYLPLRTPATQDERAAGKKDPADVYHDEEMGRLPRPATADAAGAMADTPDGELDTGKLLPVAKRIPVAQRLTTPANRRVIATALAAPLAKKWSADSKARNFFASRHWVPEVAAKHAPKVAAKLGVSTERATQLLDAMLRELAVRVHGQILNGKDTGDAKKTGVIQTKDGKRVKVQLGGKGSLRPTEPGGPPKPRNAAGKGSLAPRPTRKALVSFGKKMLKAL